MNASSTSVEPLSVTGLLDEIAVSLDHVAAVADLLRLVRTDEDLERLRIETLARAGSLIDREVEHLQERTRALPAAVRSAEPRIS